MKVLYIQYTGNFKEAYTRLFIDHGKENYYGQKYSVGKVIEQARNGMEIKVIILNSEPYESLLEERLSVVSFEDDHDLDRVVKVIEGFDPDRVIITTPNHRILRYLRKCKIKTLPVLADSFEDKSIIHIKWKYYKFNLKRELKRVETRWVANHQINAAKSLMKLGLKSQFILPYDWEHDSCPADWDIKSSDNIEKKEIQIFYAGSMIESKGVIDLINSLQYIQEEGRECLLTLAGRDTEGLISDFLERNEMSARVDYLGMVDHDDILIHMNNADLVVVPSHHDYPEGLPMTIMESLMVHTPVIASDHPMFVGRIGEKGGVLFFPQKNPKKLSDVIVDICSDIGRYSEMVMNAGEEWSNLTLDLKWADMISTWIDDPFDDSLGKYSLKSYF